MNAELQSGADDTIVAIATGNPPAAITLIRMSGSRAFEIAEACCGSRQNGDFRANPRVQRLRSLCTGRGRKLDEVLVAAFPDPASYTGEDMIEIGCHGGSLVTRQVLDALCAQGARLAKPGEFTERAFCNGKMDLTQAEGVMDLIHAQTELALSAAQSQLEGHLGEKVFSIRETLLDVLAHLEAYIDFPEEEIAPDTTNDLVGRIGQAQSSLDQLTSTAEFGKFLRTGALCVICGPPNAGKSSLLNRLLGFERAIVSATPGTTRDSIEEVIEIEGIPVRLADTAGLRDADSPLEEAGIERTHKLLDSADLVIEVIDGSPEADQPAATANLFGHGKRRLSVINKSDLGESEELRDSDAVRLSCATGEGFDILHRELADLLHASGSAEFRQSAIAVNTRHQQHLKRASEHLNQAVEGLRSMAPTELPAADIRLAIDSVGEVVGKADSEDILGKIFGQFCIGK